MNDNLEKDEHDIDDLFKWILTTFKPPASKHEFELSSKNIVIRKAENPIAVYKRLQQKYANIKRL